MAEGGGGVVPNATPEAWQHGAWKLCRTMANDLVQRDEHDNGSSDEEPNLELVQQKFKALGEERETAYNNACMGLVLSAFMKYAEKPETLNTAEVSTREEMLRNMKRGSVGSAASTRKRRAMASDGEGSPPCGTKTRRTTTPSASRPSSASGRGYRGGGLVAGAAVAMQLAPQDPARILGR